MRYTTFPAVRRMMIAVTASVAFASIPAQAEELQQVRVEAATLQASRVQPARLESGEGLESASVFLDPGQFIWKPDPAASGPIKVVVSLPLQVAYVFKGSTLIATSSVSTGLPGYDTPVGAFTILQKEVDHKSSLYDDAPMPFMQRLTWDGVALHAGKVTGQRASHGCVRLPAAFAKKLYRETSLGAEVVIVDEAPLSADEAFAAAPADLLASR